MIQSRWTVMAAPLIDSHHRSVANWYKVVESFTSAAETLMNKSIKEIKSFVNNKLAGPSGPAMALEANRGQ